MLKLAEMVLNPHEVARKTRRSISTKAVVSADRKAKKLLNGKVASAITSKLDCDCRGAQLMGAAALQGHAPVLVPGGSPRLMPVCRTLLLPLPSKLWPETRRKCEHPRPPVRLRLLSGVGRSRHPPIGRMRPRGSGPDGGRSMHGRSGMQRGPTCQPCPRT